MTTPNNQQQSFNPSSVSAVFAATVLGTVGASTILVMPGLLGVIVTALGLSESQLGFVASVDIFTFAIATGLTALLIGRYNWRVLAGIGLGILAAGNLASMFAGTYEAMLWSRCLAGVGEGVAVGVSFAALGATRNPDRSFGIYLVFALIFSAAALYVFPYLVEFWGHTSVFVFLITLCLLNILLLPALTPQSKVHIGHVDASEEHVIPYRLVGIGFVMVTLFFIAQGAVWSYLERIGAANALDPKIIGGALALSALAGVMGAGLATLLGDKYGRILPISFGLVVQSISMLMLTTGLTEFEFYCAVMMFNFSWNLCQPYFSGIMAEFDPQGRVVVLMGSIQTIGVAVGPFLAALLIMSGGLSRICYLGIACLIGTLITTIVLLRQWPGKHHGPAVSNVGTVA